MQFLSVGVNRSVDVELFEIFFCKLCTFNNKFYDSERNVQDKVLFLGQMKK